MRQTHTLLALWIAGCAPQSEPTLSETQLALSRQVGIPESTFQTIRRAAKTDLVALHPLDSAGTVLPPRGLVFGLPASGMRTTLAKLRQTLGDAYLVFEADRGYTYHPDSIGIVHTRDTMELLRVMVTSGVNYGIYTDSVISVVRHWRDSLGFRLEAGGGDWLEGSFPSPQPDFDSLAVLVYAFCPDVVDQGANTVPGLAVEMRKIGKLFCWWD